MSSTTARIALSLVAVLALAATAPAQWLDPLDSESAWEVSANAGYFSGATWLETSVGGEPVTLETDSSWLIGVKAGTEDEYLGLELSLAGAFADGELEVDPAALIGDAGDVNMFLGDVNVLLFPTGNTLAEGRIRPFVTAGTGLFYFDSDFGPADNETALDVNAGAGVKVLLGDEGNVVLRLDWRWHWFTATSSGLKNNIYAQELTAGLGFRF